jgi:hypothetical protein
MTLLGASGATPLPAQARASADSAKWMEVVRPAMERYRDRAVAIADGYRAIGPDAPAMGQHWVHPQRVLAGGVDPAAPSILMYTVVNGETVLIGVAYAQALGSGEADPSSPASPADWHFHSGTVAGEAMLLGHAGHHAGRTEQARVAVLHAWTGVENPAGLFTAENWALPFLRLGLTPPNGPDHRVARGLTLIAGGAGFFAEQVGIAADLEPLARQRVRRHLDRGAGSLQRWWSGRPAGTPLSEGEARQVTAIWTEVVEAVLREVPNSLRWRLRDGLL